MSFTATFDTFTNVSNVTPGQRLVLAAISTFTNKQGTCFPSLKAIAERTSLTVRSVQRHLASLIRLGFIERIYHTGRSALTRINLARLSPATTTGGGDNFAVGGGDKNDTQNLSFEPINIKTAVLEPATPEPQHQHATAAVSPPFFISEIPEQPEQPTPEIESLPDYCAQLQAFANSQYAPTEAIKTPVEPSKEVEGTNPPTDTNHATSEADPLADVPATLLADLGTVRVAKKRPAKVTKTEAALWWTEAQKAGWTMQQVITTMILHGWARFQADWVQHVPPQTAPGRDSVFQPETFTPASHSAIARFKESWAKQRAQILADSAQRREQTLARMRQ